MRPAKSKHITNIVLVGVFCSLDTEGRHEQRAREIVLRELGEGVNVVCSSEVGHLGLLERENASILNASILTFAQRTVRGFKRAIQRLNLTCPLYLTQNDGSHGTLTTAAEAAALPIRTLASGQMNNMRGASSLAGLDLRKDSTSSGKSVIVCDLGGTTCDVGVLLPSRFPGRRRRTSRLAVCELPSRCPICSVSAWDEAAVSEKTRRQAVRQLGPIPSAITSLAPPRSSAARSSPRQTSPLHLDVPTSGTRRSSPPSLISSLRLLWRTSRSSSRMSLTGADDTGTRDGLDGRRRGSIIAPDELEGVGEILRPPFFGVANAVGAAMAEVTGEIEKILAEAKQESAFDIST